MFVIIRYACPFEGPESVTVLSVESKKDTAVWQQLLAVSKEIGVVGESIYKQPSAGGFWAQSKGETIEIWEQYLESVAGYLSTRTQLAQRKVAVFMITSVTKATAENEAASLSTPSPQVVIKPKPLRKPIPCMDELRATVSRRKKHE